MSVPNTTSPGPMPRGPRMNAKPAIIVIVMVGLFIVGIIYAAQSRSTLPQRANNSEKVFELKIDADKSVDFLNGKPDGLAGFNQPGPATQLDDSEAVSSIEQDMAAWLENQQLRKLEQNANLREQYEQRQIQLYEEALASPLLVAGFGSGNDHNERSRVVQDQPLPRSSFPTVIPDAIMPAAATGVNTGAIDQEQLTSLINSESGRQILNSLGISADSVAGLRTPTATDNSGVQRSNAFLGQSAQNRSFTLYEELETPRSPFEIKTGTLISGAMISAASSDLPGDIVAQVTRNVYDSASGRYLLIPQGTKLFGQYDAFTQLGQERLLIVWNRLIFEDGETLDIGGMQGYDARGLSGFKDRVNTHFLRTLGNALLISVVNAAGDEIVDRATDEANAQFTLNLAQHFAGATQSAFDDYLRSRLRIKPTIEIRSGYRFNIVVSKDINFPRPFERGFKAYNTSR